MEPALLKDVDRRLGRISGTLALVYIAVFAKFGLWQALNGAWRRKPLGNAIMWE